MRVSLLSGPSVITIVSNKHWESISPLLGVGIWIAAWLSPPQKGISHPWIRWKPLQYQYRIPHPATSESECQHLKYIWGQKSNLTRYRLKTCGFCSQHKNPKNTLKNAVFFWYFETTKQNLTEVPIIYCLVQKSILQTFLESCSLVFLLYIDIKC